MNTRLSIFLTLLLLPVAAHAHPGIEHGASFLSGFYHPLQGIDHIIVMVAVGILAMRQGGRNVYLLPLTFASVMAASSVLAMSGINIAYTETGILWSNAALCALVLISHRFSTVISMMIIGFFAIFHGSAHGAEMPVTSESYLYMTGFVSATLLLHGLGLLLAWQLTLVKSLNLPKIINKI